MTSEKCAIKDRFLLSLLVPEAGFIGAEPKLKPTTADTETRNFSVMDSSKLWSILKPSPDYGKLKNDMDRASSDPNGLSNLTKHTSRATYGRLERPQYEPQSSRVRVDSVRDDQISFQPSQLIVTKAGSRVSAEIILATYKEKRKLVQDHFPKEEKEWQRWFVEATVWGELCTFTPRIDTMDLLT